MLLIVGQHVQSAHFASGKWQGLLFLNTETRDVCSSGMRARRGIDQTTVNLTYRLTFFFWHYCFASSLVVGWAVGGRTHEETVE